MTTFTLRRFSEPDALKAIAPARLKGLLGRFATYFNRRGVHFEAGSSIDYEKLAGVLMTPDEDVPAEMVDALYFVHEMSQGDAVDRMIAIANAKNLDLPFDSDLSPADLAIAIWLIDPNVLQELHAEAFVMRPRRFEYHSGAFGESRPFPACGPEQLAAAEAQLDRWFVEHQRGGGSKLLVFNHGSKVHLLIRHGATMRREGSIKHGEREIQYYRPEVHDVLMYDNALDALGVAAATKGLRELYRKVVGEIIFGDVGYFSSDFDLTLDPLLEQGPEALVCEDVPGLSSVALVEIRKVVGGAIKEKETNQATDLFKAFGENWRRRMTYGRLVSATFQVTLGEGRNKRKRRVTISLPREAKFDRDDEDADAIERWLKRRGLMPLNEEDDREAPAASSLGDAAEPSSTGNGKAGVAASAG